MSIYRRLGIRTVINGNATLTRLGGSIMPPVVVDAMAEASKHFVDIIELQQRVGEELARLTHNEAAYVSCGAAAALTHLHCRPVSQVLTLENVKNFLILIVQ